MSLTNDLLDQARHLATREPIRPKQSSLSRAVSTAYYALFHMLVDAACVRLLHRKSEVSLRPLLSRSFNHGDMVNAAKTFKSGQPIALVLDALNDSIPTEIKIVATAFVDLQEMRHQADYNTNRNWSRTEVQNLVDQAINAEQAWRRVRNHKAATALLVNMLVHKQLIKR